MKDKNRPSLSGEPSPIAWRQLTTIASEQLIGSLDLDHWRTRITDRLIALRYEIPRSSTIGRAMEYAEKRAGVSIPFRRASENPRPIPPKPKPPIPPALDVRARAGRHLLTPIARVRAVTISNACGALKSGSGMKPLRCNRAKNHVGDHGMATSEGAPLFVRWANEADEA